MFRVNCLDTFALVQGNANEAYLICIYELFPLCHDDQQRKNIVQDISHINSEMISTKNADDKSRKRLL